MADLKAAACKPTNMARIYDVRQGIDESPIAYLNRLMMAFRQTVLSIRPGVGGSTAGCHPNLCKSGSTGYQEKVTIARTFRGKETERDLVAVAENVYNKRKTEEGRKEKKGKKGRKERARERKGKTKI